MNAKSIPTTIHGVNVINQLGKSLLDFGAKNAFLITDKGLTKVGLTDQVGEKIKNANINLVAGEAPHAICEYTHPFRCGMI